MTFVAARLLPAFAVPAVTATLMLAGSAPVLAAGAAWQESGQASWYGGMHNGRRTSNGETFDENDLTAAHPSLPLGSRVRVTLQDTGDSVVVRITDRQPYHGRRIIDLSRGAASQIGLVYRGTGMVTLSSVNGPALANAPLEVAETPASYEDDSATAASPRRHGRRHRHHAARAA